MLTKTTQEYLADAERVRRLAEHIGSVEMRIVLLDIAREYDAKAAEVAQQSSAPRDSTSEE